MLDFQPTIEFHSETQPGVSFVVKRLSVIERSRRDAGILDHQLEYEELMRVLKEFPKSKDGKFVDPVAARKIDAQIASLLNVHIHPAVLRAGLVEVRGVSFNGQPITVDQFIQVADEEMVYEASTCCDLASRLSMEQLKNLASPGTSREPATKTSASTSVVDASENSDTSAATADDTSLSK